MFIIFDSAALPVNVAGFALGILPASTIEADPFRDDYRTFRCPVSAADIDEQTAHSIARTIAEETASYRDRIREADIEAEWDRLAEQAEFEARLDLYC